MGFPFGYMSHKGDDINRLAGKEEELAKLVNKLHKASMPYGMEINAEKKNKLMMNSDITTTTDIAVHGQKLETFQQVRYLGTIISDVRLRPEIFTSSAQTAALAKLKTIWRNKTITMKYRIRLLHALVFSIFLYTCDVGPHSRAPEDSGDGTKMPTQDPGHLCH